MTKPQVMIVAGEASGDLHGANLIRALRRQIPSVEVSGMGGSELAQAGVTILVDAAQLAVVGIIEVLSHLKEIRRAFRILTRHLTEARPDLLILVDYPDFNFLLARKAKRLGIPVLYYISPQIWAWRTGRVKKIKRLVDRMAVILPFEEEFYNRHGVKVDFVGHPLMDAVATSIPRETYLRRHKVDPGRKVVGLLPGSRKKEIRMMLPIFLEAARIIAKQHPQTTFLLACAPTLEEKDLAALGVDDSRLDLRVVFDQRYEMMHACDAAMAASGTVTLELAILGVPMAVAYKVSPVTFFLGRRLIKVEHAALVNLVAGRRLVPELLQDDAEPEPLARVVTRFLEDQEEAARIREGLAEVRQRLGSPGASERAAHIAREMILGRVSE